MKVRFAFALAAGLAVGLGAGCRPSPPRPALAADDGIGFGLGDREASNRRRAAEKLRSDDGPPPDAVPHLLRAIAREVDPDAMAEMLITVGASGAPDAKPVLDARVGDPERAVRRGAEKGLERWNRRTANAAAAKTRVSDLESRDAGVRRDAAKNLGLEGGPPPEAIGPLVAAAKKEQDPKALAAMLTTLGNTGATEARPVLEAHVDDKNADPRRAAQKALKKWRTKNGQAVRRDVETPAEPAAAKGGGGDSSAGDGCNQFKEICGADPLSLDKCKSDLKSMNHADLEAWAECVNASSSTCQKAHDDCVAKLRKAR